MICCFYELRRECSVLGERGYQWTVPREARLRVSCPDPILDDGLDLAVYVLCTCDSQTWF